jgi:iron(III) transport system substrate-binding protein
VLQRPRRAPSTGGSRRPSRRSTDSVDTLEARASELLERVRTEQASGRSLGDVSYNGSTATERQMQDSVFVPTAGFRAHLVLRRPSPATGRESAFVIHFGILVNTESVKPSDEPRSWKDSSSPLERANPRGRRSSVGSETSSSRRTYGKLGREFHEKLAAAELHPRPRGPARRPGSTRYSFPRARGDEKELEGLPLKTVVPSEGAVYVLYQTAIFKNASHPNAARLFMDFLLSDEAQAICRGRIWAGGRVRQRNLPAGAPRHSELKTMSRWLVSRGRSTSNVSAGSSFGVSRASPVRAGRRDQPRR